MCYFVDGQIKLLIMDGDGVGGAVKSTVLLWYR